MGDGNKKTTILEPYKDPVGLWTIGYGNRFINGVEVTQATKPITAQEALKLFTESLVEYERRVAEGVSKMLKQSQFDALVSFCFNLGNIDGLKDKVNGNTITRQDFLKYVYAKGKKLPGLVTRRNKEADYYFK